VRPYDDVELRRRVEAVLAVDIDVQAAVAPHCRGRIEKRQPWVVRMRERAPGESEVELGCVGPVADQVEDVGLKGIRVDRFDDLDSDRRDDLPAPRLSITCVQRPRPQPMSSMGPVAEERALERLVQIWGPLLTNPVARGKYTRRPTLGCGKKKRPQGASRPEAVPKTTLDY
jgi:hypothetical protein